MNVKHISVIGINTTYTIKQKNILTKVLKVFENN